MGIVLRHVETGKLIFYLKGAEVVMKEKVKPNERVTIDEACENLAKLVFYGITVYSEGLRTLVIS
jgi:phospholipid-translocating ATPase